MFFGFIFLACHAELKLGNTQTLQEPDAPPTAEAPAPVAPVAPAEEKPKVPIIGEIKDKAESDAVEISQKMGFHLTNEDKCEHKLKNGKCAPKLGEQFELSPLVSFLLIILVIVPAMSLVVVWAREPTGLEGLMQVCCLWVCSCACACACACVRFDKMDGHHMYHDTHVTIHMS